MPSMILWYFVNEGLNNSGMVASMQTIADKVIDSYINDISYQVQEHSLDPRVTAEVKNMLLGSCHRVEKVRVVSQRALDRLISAFPSLLCDEEVVVTILEILTLLRQGCEGQYRDEYYPVYHYTSQRAKISFDLSDSYPQRNEILTRFLERARRYMRSLLTRAPIELQGILQRYLGTFDDGHLPLSSELGKSVAIEFARALPSTSSGVPDVYLPDLGGWRADSSSAFVNELSARATYMGEMTGIHLALTKGLLELQRDPASNFSADSVRECERQLANVSRAVSQKQNLPFADLRRLLYRSAALAVALPKPNFDLLHYIVSIPLKVFTPSAIKTASHVWTWIIGERPSVETKIMVEISLGWALTIKQRRGLFSRSMDWVNPLLEKTEMSPSDRVAVSKEREQATRQFVPHLTLVQMLSSRFEAFRYRDPSMVLALVRLIQRSGAATPLMSRHPLSRETRFALVVFGLRLLQGSRLDGLLEFQLRESMYNLALQWFSVAPLYSFGSNRLQVAAEMAVLQQLLEVLRTDDMRAEYVITSFPPTIEGVRLPGHKTINAAKASVSQRRSLLQLLVEDELSNLSVWNNPLSDSTRGSDYSGAMLKAMNDAKWSYMLELAWKVDAAIAVHMVKRFKTPFVRQEVGRLVRSQPARAVSVPDALELLIDDHLTTARKQGTDLKWLLYWSPVTPVECITLFLPEYGNDPYLLQYAMRALEQHPVDLTFFYVPQLVQALRDDEFGYVAQFIFETSKISQLFCHQIIWNMKANSYKDDNAEEPDPMKPTLDRMTSLIVGALSGEAQDFYDREFGFFNEVTSISGKLKPYIKKSKAEKKAKIDEEMALIKVDPGVYLPSNPDGVVVDLARKSGRPLQSHAKAPFMATFKVKREVPEHQAAENNTSGSTTDAATSGKDTSGADTAIDTDNSKKVSVEVWQAAIFKVGDDCRQDVLALQAIAMLKNIWQAAGLDLYLNPYRVTATGPGCGVIDVVPNATSRDEMGRAQINDLNAFFLQRFGNADSISYQQARLNFVRSMAGYSLACHLLQIRDRHNGNIMIDGEGHLIHIDFGFLFEIGPGGMRFEPFSFKLSLEFIEVMGGDTSQGYKMFSELLVKGYLALRPYTEQIISLCRMMYGTDLPSFKGLPTFDHLRDRFKPQLNEREAAQHAVGLIEDAHTNRRAVLYDQIQYLQNSIPYRK
jgi:phosphatidylinositol 4-kinase